MNETTDLAESKIQTEEMNGAWPRFQIFHLLHATAVVAVSSRVKAASRSRVKSGH
jgi:hypothetical protein